VRGDAYPGRRPGLTSAAIPTRAGPTRAKPARV
jgi:hypothetical protein